MDCRTSGFLSFIISQSLLKFRSIESVMLFNHLILCHPLLLLPSISPSIRIVSNESALRIWWPKYSGWDIILRSPSTVWLLVSLLTFFMESCPIYVQQSPVPLYTALFSVQFSTNTSWFTTLELTTIKLKLIKLKIWIQFFKQVTFLVLNIECGSDLHIEQCRDIEYFRHHRKFLGSAILAIA